MLFFPTSSILPSIWISGTTEPVGNPKFIVYLSVRFVVSSTPYVLLYASVAVGRSWGSNLSIYETIPTSWSDTSFITTLNFLGSFLPYVSPSFVAATAPSFHVLPSSCIVSGAPSVSNTLLS
ncbi:hypothetical protein AX774_g65 [Zancudomyces culisetae]|uniref:Uncharacterized protein n=1 Tax=Zancudomyces culisetae TaxID=1213189 RepID=A0A1R1PZJ0_ZANCU|nr:hypothetical protein AX774_g65 [Zancudomyces culisetae]|eukprot:OMH86378.1 hypothetical protein AX774_g65 [Zancudomyces culisetae]